MTGEEQTKILTFQTFVTELAFYQYASVHPQEVPFLLVDRSPCLDPFFDPYADLQDRQPLISGLCRGLKNFQVGHRFLYVTRIDWNVYDELVERYPHLDTDRAIQGPRYFGVAALRVVWVWENHADAAKDFTPRRYVVAPDLTPYPPNLAHASYPEGAVARASCIVHDANKVAYTPMTSTDAMWRGQIHGYHGRQVKKRLRVAGCEVEWIDGREALRLDPESAPVFTNADWNDMQMNVSGRYISEEVAAPLRKRIADSQK